MIRLIFGVFSISFAVLMACGSSTQETTYTNISLDSVNFEPAATFLSKFSNRIQQIAVSENGLLRGFTPGQSIDSISQWETATIDYDSTSSKGYTLGDPLTSSDIFDIKYCFQPASRQTDSMLVDTYLNSLQASDSLMAELSTYFTTRLGQPVTRKPKLLVWESGKNQVLVKDVGIKLSPGLQIVVRQKR